MMHVAQVIPTSIGGLVLPGCEEILIDTFTIWEFFSMLASGVMRLLYMTSL